LHHVRGRSLQRGRSGSRRSADARGREERERGRVPRPPGGARAVTPRAAFRRWARSRGRGATAWNVAFVALFAAVVLGCASPGAGTSEGSEGERVARGRALFESKGLSPSAMNLFRCVSCHDVTPRASGLLKPGAPLAGVTLRPTFWGGQEA